MKYNIHKAAIDYAREKSHHEIVDLLSKGPIKATKAETKTKAKTKKKGKAEKRSSNQKKELPTSKSPQNEDEINQLKEEIARLKGYLFALKGDTRELDFFDFSDYRVKSVIGEGAMSSVKLVVKNEEFAMKELKGSDYKSVKRFLTEGEVMFILRHPCVLDIVAVNYGDDSHPPSLILKLEPTSLESAIAKKTLEDIDKCRITVEIVLGMRYIHRHNYMHRDLKPSNILLSKDCHARISDFGLAKEESFEISQTKEVGTLRFMAPELFNEEEDEEEAVKYTNKIDVYSFGITLIYIVTGSYPKFNMKKVSNGVLPRLSESIVTWVRELIVSCLSFEAENRPSFETIFETLKANNYDLFKENDGNKLTRQQESMKKEIDARVLMIEAYEFQHQNE